MTKKRWLAGWMVGMALATMAAPAWAADEAPAATETESTDAASSDGDPTVHMQDGFYLSFGLGGGYFHDDFKSDFILASVSGSADGASGAGELLAGGALKPGLILGGGVFFEQVTNPTIKIEGKTVNDDISVGTLVVVGPFIDWYLTPGEGFHLRGALGGARITLKDETGQQKDKEDEPVGGAAVLAVGYNWWLADQWSFGVMGRITGGALRANGVSHDVGATSLILSVTYN